MKHVLRLLQGGVLITFALGAVVLAGCSAGAQDAAQRGSSSQALGTSARPGGMLVCFGQRIEGIAGTWFTKIHPFNNNDEVSISIDKMIVYDYDGSTPCDPLPSFVLAPHATLDLNMNRGPFPTACSNWAMATSPGTGGFSVVLYWSVVDNPRGYVNGLAAYSDVYQTRASGQFGWTSHGCEAITLPPDKCAEKKCRTKDICGQQAQCEVCVEGKCVVNTPHFDAACVPSCGSADALCGVQGVCGYTTGTCLPSWDCPSCCTSP